MNKSALMKRAWEIYSNLTGSFFKWDNTAETEEQAAPEPTETAEPKTEEPHAMQVKTYVVNKGEPSQYFGLKDAKENTVLHFAPTWKTEKGAINWAKKHGFEVVGIEDKTPTTEPTPEPETPTELTKGTIFKQTEEFHSPTTKETTKSVSIYEVTRINEKTYSLKCIEGYWKDDLIQLPKDFSYPRTTFESYGVIITWEIIAVAAEQTEEKPKSRFTQKSKPETTPKPTPEPKKEANEFDKEKREEIKLYGFESIQQLKDFRDKYFTPRVTVKGDTRPKDIIIDFPDWKRDAEEKGIIRLSQKNPYAHSQDLKEFLDCLKAYNVKIEDWNNSGYLVYCGKTADGKNKPKRPKQKKAA